MAMTNTILTDAQRDAAFDASMAKRPKEASNAETRRLFAMEVESATVEALVRLAGVEAVALQLWCETCEGEGRIYEESQAGVVGSGGRNRCPDCEGCGYVNTRRYYPPEAIAQLQARIEALSAQLEAQGEAVSIPADVLKAAKSMQSDGYRGPFAWAKKVIDFVADYNHPAPAAHSWSGDPSTQDFASTQPAPAAPVEAQGEAVESESVLIEGIAYAVPVAVAAEMLRLHLENMGATQERDAVYALMDSKREYVEGLRSALVYHMEQTRPIQRSIDALATGPAPAAPVVDNKAEAQAGGVGINCDCGLRGCECDLFR